MIHALLLASAALVAPPAPPPVQQPDPEGPARSAAYRYESLLRRRIPYRAGSGGGGPCDEIIGRFCFTFTDDEEESSDPPEPEHADIGAARRLAVRAFRAWLSAEPENARAAGGLIRYLIEDDRSDEAVSVARTHVWAHRSAESMLLLGLALHYKGEFVAAEAAFDSARALSTVEERDQLDDIGVLLIPKERSAYDDLDPVAKRAYERRFWALADPSRRTPGNERRSAHYARHAWIQILSRAPRAQGMIHWGDDHEEIVLRFGLPTNRERIRSPAWRYDLEDRIVSIFDPQAVAFVPSALTTEGIPSTPDPADEPDPERRIPRSEYTPILLPTTRPMEAQATRFPGTDGWTLRVDATLRPDSADPRLVAPQGLLTVLDTLGRELTRVPARVDLRRDSLTVVRVEARGLAPGTYVYQLEIADDSTGIGGLYRRTLDVPDGDLSVSDPLIATAEAGPLPRDRTELEPSPTRVLAPEQTVLVYVEVVGLGRGAGTARYAVEWWLEPLDRGSLVGQALRWVGRGLGLVGRSRPTRVQWDAATEVADPVPVAFALDLTGAEPGLHRLGLRIVDRLTGREATSYRVVRLEPRSAPLSVPGPG